jgi:hypothetical protein
MKSRLAAKIERVSKKGRRPWPRERAETPFSLMKTNIMRVSSLMGSPISEGSFTAGFRTDASALVLPSIQHRQS